MAGRNRTHDGKTYTLTEAHPAADLFPWFSDELLQQTADDIKARGLKQKIVRCRGLIVDGRNRELACLVAGIRPQYSDLPASTPESEILAGVITANLRRDLTPSQRAMIAAELETLRHGGDRKSQDATLRLGQNREQIASTLHVSPRSVTTAAQVKRDAPELTDPIKNGKLDVHTASRLRAYPAEVRREVAESDDPKATAGEVLAEPLDDPLPRPMHDASPPERLDPFKHSRKHRRDPKEHPHYRILKAMSDLSRMLTLAMNAPDGGKLKDHLRFFGLVLDRGFILNGKKYNARFKGFQFRNAIKVAVGRKVWTKAELMKLCAEEWEDAADLEGMVPE